MKTEQIAELCHEVSRAYCKINGLDSQVTWDDAPQWQKDSAIDGIEKINQAKTDLLNSNSSAHIDPQLIHKNWMEYKLRDGWRYGPVKNAELKEHPTLLPYSVLPAQDKFKDLLFSLIAQKALNFFQRSNEFLEAELLSQAIPIDNAAIVRNE